MPRFSAFAFVTALLATMGSAAAQNAPDQTATPPAPQSVAAPPSSGTNAAPQPNVAAPQHKSRPPTAHADSVEMAAPAPPPQNCPQDECPTPQ